MHSRFFALAEQSIGAVLLLLFCITPAHSQECQDCKTRRVILYDNEVNVARPSTVDSIYRYWDYFFIAGGVRDYASNIDPSRDCIRRLDGAFFTKKDTVSGSIKFGVEHANLPPPGEASEWTNYILYGVVTGQSFTLRLEAGKSRELVKSAVIALPSGFDPFQIGRTVAAFIGPLYTTIMEFERKKRDQGEPYAIVPMVTLIPGKAKLKVNEKTTIDVLFKDCDGAPLKQRHLTFTADGGTLKSADVTTDDQGRGTLEFTAGPIPALANVTTEYLYQLPTGPISPGRCEPASIQIDKASTSWYVTATYQVDNQSGLSRQNPLETVTGADQDNTKLTFSAWATNISPIAGQLSVIPLTVSQVVYSGIYTESSYWHSHWETSAGGVSAMSDDLLTSVVSAGSTKARTPDVTLSIYKDSYAFGIQKMDAAQTGGETRVTRSVDPISGSKTETTVSPASPQKTLGLSVQGVNRDTTYSVSETTTQAGRSTTTVTQVTQKFSWKDNVCKLNYTRGIREESQLSSIYTENTYSNQTYAVTLFLTYTGDPPTWVEPGQQILPTAFALSQNYPNPFNPTTTVSYVLPSATHVLLIITDVLGRKVGTLEDEEKSVGVHVLSWNASGLPSGVYFLQMRAGGFVETRKLLLTK